MPQSVAPDLLVTPGTIPPPEEEALCKEHDFPVLRKPSLASDVMNQIRSRLLPVTRRHPRVVRWRVSS